MINKTVHQDKDQLPSIALVGLMGVGKTTVSQILAQSLQLLLVDTDQDIEQYTGKTIQEIFLHQGEQTFRTLERHLIKKRLEKSQPYVIALGGGAFIDPHTRTLIKHHTFSVWLRASLQTMIQRTYPYQNRPLLTSGNPHNTLANLITQRYPIYAQANIVINTDNLTPQQITQHIITHLHTNPQHKK